MIPTLTGEQVILTPFTLEDAPLVQRYAGDAEVAKTTLNVPHPYLDGVAEQWIATHQPQFIAKDNVVFAIRSKASKELIGTINLVLNLDLPLPDAELGYWIGVPFWGKGYCTDAARTVIKYGFETFPINQIYARHLTVNPASGRVMKKSGMTLVPREKQEVVKWGQQMEVVKYALWRTGYVDRFAAA